MSQPTLVAPTARVIGDAGAVTADDSSRLPLALHVLRVVRRVSSAAFGAPAPKISVSVRSAVTGIVLGQRAASAAHSTRLRVNRLFVPERGMSVDPMAGVSVG